MAGRSQLRAAEHKGKSSVFSRLADVSFLGAGRKWAARAQAEISAGGRGSSRALGGGITRDVTGGRAAQGGWNFSFPVERSREASFLFVADDLVLLSFR